MARDVVFMIMMRAINIIVVFITWSKNLKMFFMYRNRFRDLSKDDKVNMLVSSFLRRQEHL
ncbi:MAG: hypothetical protein ACLTA8_08140 [Intestinibacter bartlettii]